jgi:hypothetical protein
LAVDPIHVYWANSSTGSIGRASLDGSDVNQSFVTGANNPVGVAVDAAELSPTHTSVYCAPDSAPIGTPASCTASVMDTSSGAPSAPSGTVTFAADIDGSVSNLGSCTLSSISTTMSTCQLAYTLHQTGSTVITATYGGDAEHAATYGQTAVSISYRSTSTSVTCSPTTVPVGVTSTCTVVVTDTDTGTPSVPTGSVQGFWSDSGQGGYIGSGSCNLSPVSSTQSQCALAYTPTAVGSGQTLISATHASDGVHGQNTMQASVGVSRRATSVAVSCSPALTVSGHQTLCTATVRDTGSGTWTTPTGALTFNGDVSSGWPGGVPPACNLSSTGSNSASCSLAYLPRLMGTQSRLDTITATYSGDAAHDGGSGATQVTVTLTATPAVLTRPASSVTAARAVLNATINPRGQPTVYRFEYGTSTAYGARTPTVDTAVGSDTADHAVSQAISGLALHTTYHYRVVATNPAGTGYGSDQQFTTQLIPTAAASVPGKVGALGAELKFTFACQGTAGQSCQVQTTATAIEKLSSSGTVTAVLSTKPRTGRYRVITILKGDVGAAAGQRKDVSTGLNSSGRMLRNKFKNIPSDVKITNTTNGAAIRTAKVTFGPDPPKTSLAATPTAKAAKVRFRLRCRGHSGQGCKGSARIATYEKLAADGKPVTGLSSAPAGKGKLVTIANISWSVRAGITGTIIVQINTTGQNLLKRFGKVPGTLTITPTYNGYTLPALTATITFKR